MKNGPGVVGSERKVQNSQTKGLILEAMETWDGFKQVNKHFALIDLQAAKKRIH